MLVACKRANYSVVARCEVHGTAVKPGMKAGEKQYMSAFALNEWDSKLAGGVEWRQKIDTQVRGVLCAATPLCCVCSGGGWSLLTTLHRSLCGHVD